ncbi:hypothetical protein [Sediminibacterium soli]|uniref:hypothetical protein n=1 Tax=Sediminibacterium soli TaxID=2698829 RepID=UPI0013794C7C|nr:hypothetical protein [Sediminibacterium soli]NCI46219.1 hypothetical protein [Sediminibacterium soli]
MWKKLSAALRFPFWLGLVIFCFVFSGCAAAGEMRQPAVWLGVLDLAAAGAITVYIFRGGDQEAV